MERETAGWVMYRLSAARVTFIVRQTSKKMRMWRMVTAIAPIISKMIWL